MTDLIRKITDYWVPQQYFQNDEQLRQARLLVNSAFIVILFCTFYIPIYASFIFFPLGVINCLYSIASATGLLFFFRKNGNFIISGNFFSFTACAFFTIFILTNGGINSPMLPWLTIVPIAAFTLVNAFYGKVWAVIAFVVLNIFWVLDLTGVKFDIHYPAEWTATLHYFLIGGLMIFIVLIIILYEQGHNRVKNELRIANDEVLHTNAELESQNEEIHQQHESLMGAFREITDNVNYAQRLQQAIFGSPQGIKDYVKDSFIFFEPRDIVSGDFYWFTKITSGGSTKTIVVVADCTGHGVSGAFMTVLGYDFLNDIVLSKQLTDPGVILEQLDKKVIGALQDQSQGELNDGMDIGILLIDEENQEVLYAGAKHPLYYVQNQTIVHVKGSNYPIGSQQYHQPKEFEVHRFKWQKGTRYYMLSDGFQDQFGGLDDKKYLKSRLRNYLHSIAHITMEEQYEALTKEFHNWKGNQGQTDDVLVLGLCL